MVFTRQIDWPLELFSKPCLPNSSFSRLSSLMKKEEKQPTTPMPASGKKTAMKESPYDSTTASYAGSEWSISRRNGMKPTASRTSWRIASSLGSWPSLTTCRSKTLWKIVEPTARPVMPPNIWNDTIMPMARPASSTCWLAFMGNVQPVKILPRPTPARTWGPYFMPSETPGFHSAKRPIPTARQGHAAMVSILYFRMLSTLKAPATLNTTMTTHMGSTLTADLSVVSRNVDWKERSRQSRPSVQHCAMRERADQSEICGPAPEDAVRKNMLNGPCFVKAEGYQEEQS